VLPSLRGHRPHRPQPCRRRRCSSLSSSASRSFGICSTTRRAGRPGRCSACRAAPRRTVHSTPRVPSHAGHAVTRRVPARPHSLFIGDHSSVGVPFAGSEAAFTRSQTDRRGAVSLAVRIRDARDACIGHVG